MGLESASAPKSKSNRIMLFGGANANSKTGRSKTTRQRRRRAQQQGLAPNAKTVDMQLHKHRQFIDDSIISSGPYRFHMHSDDEEDDHLFAGVGSEKPTTKTNDEDDDEHGADSTRIRTMKRQVVSKNGKVAPRLLRAEQRLAEFAGLEHVSPSLAFACRTHTCKTHASLSIFPSSI